MTFSSRLFLAVLVIGVDILAFAVPLAAFAVAYVLVARPAGFLQWVLRLYDDQGRAAAG
ncbi:MAG: hypothetical protein ABR538_13920 [Candidatus Binatia bacterium]